MIWPIFKKDWTLLWPLAVLVTLIQIVLEWAFYRVNYFGSSDIARELLGLLTPAWYIGTMALAVGVVHEDTIPGVDQDWLIRPVNRSHLLLAKMLFVLATVCVPMLVVNLLDELALGFPFAPSLGGALYKEAYLFVCLLVPAMALGSVSRNMADLVVLVGGLVVLYAASLWVTAMLFGTDWCPTCDTSIEWIPHLLQHAGVLVGAGIVLTLQYYRRVTRVSRLVLAAGVVLLVVAQLPWNAAFAIQGWLGKPVGTRPAAIRFAADDTEVDAGGGPGRGVRGGGAREATRALLQGDVDTALRGLKRSPHAAPVVLTVPLRVTGLAQDEFLAVDRAVYSLVDANGVVLYTQRAAERRAVPLVPDPAAPESLQQKFEVPGTVYSRIGAAAVSLVADFSLTVRTPIAEHRIRAVDGEIASPDVGVCRSNASHDSSGVACRQIGYSRSCYSAILFGPDGRHNPQVYSCGADYRPFIPSRADIVTLTGISVPIRDPYGIARYDVDESVLSDSYIMMKVFEAGAHFRRTVVSHIQPPAAH